MIGSCPRSDPYLSCGKRRRGAVHHWGSPPWNPHNHHTKPTLGMAKYWWLASTSQSYSPGPDMNIEQAFKGLIWPALASSAQRRCKMPASSLPVPRNNDLRGLERFTSPPDALGCPSSHRLLSRLDGGNYLVLARSAHSIVGMPR